MIISVQDNLKELMLNLESLGYTVHKFSDKKASDVYIYSGRDTKMSNMTNSIDAAERGTLLINADNKSLNEILYAINNRTYSPLF
ncbi:MAG: YkuS family protein [Clostridiales bacterium]|nr:YkuS family protein [Clostridiales bacterium]